MKAARIHSFGSSQSLQLEDTPRPDLQPGELLVAVRNAGVNPVDWKIREGNLPRAVALPFTSGQDFAGRVLEAPADASAFVPGARVYGFARGSYAEFAAARTDEIALLPDSLPFETAAALPTPGLTAWQILHAAGLSAGQSVLIHGAGGSVGSLAVQMARRLGARVAATALASDIAWVASLGADPVINNAQQRFEEVESELDVVIDLVGGELQRRSCDALRRGGVLASTVGIEDASAAARRGVRAIAFVMRRNAADLATLARLAAAGELRVRIAQVLPFPQARQAQDLSQHGDAHGKVLLRVA